MANEVKPIKRSPQLTPLSKEHHDSLLFVWKIRQGLKNGTDIKLIAQFVRWFWETHLQEHFTEEEQILAPQLPPDNAMVLQMKEEHQNIEALIHINEGIADEALLAQLANAVNDHIRFEERELFPFAEKAIPADKLNFVFEHLSKEKKQCNSWENEFWIRQ